MDIRIEHLYKSYLQGEKKVIRDYSDVFQEKVCHVITGPSGCGKTTLLRILMGLEVPDSGNISGIPDRIAAAFQENRLCENFSARKNIEIVLSDSRKKRRDKAEIYLKALELEESMECPVKELSGGMKCRVSLARALASGADLLLLDEPFRELDEGTLKRILPFLMLQFQNRTVILVTHEGTQYLKEPDFILHSMG